MEQNDTAFCGECDFDGSVRRCGRHEVTPDHWLDATSNPDAMNETCFADAVLVYSGLQLQFIGKFKTNFLQ